jgi:hypothetical protein
MVTMPDSVSKRVNFLVRGPPFDPFFSVIMDEMQISVLPKNSEKIIGCQNIFYGYQLHIHYTVWTTKNYIFGTSCKGQLIS